MCSKKKNHRNLGEGGGEWRHRSSLFWSRTITHAARLEGAPSCRQRRGGGQEACQAPSRQKQLRRTDGTDGCQPLLSLFGKKTPPITAPFTHSDPVDSDSFWTFCLFVCFVFLDISEFGRGGMDPLLPPEADREADGNAKRKIQFSVPSPLTTQLDPRQVEMIRRRRPTPATLFRLTDPPSPEEDSGHCQWVLGENGALKTKLPTSTYEPPSLKAVQGLAQAHLSSLDMSLVDREDLSSGGEEEELSHCRTSNTDLREESKWLRDQCASVDTLTEKADLSCHQPEGQDAKE